MTTVLEIREFGAYLRGLRDATQRGTAIALLDGVTLALGQSRRNAVSQFTGRNGYRKTGNLLNSLYAGFEREGDKAISTAFVGARSSAGRETNGGETQPYARIHEYGSKGLPGGKIRPVKAKWLWVKQWFGVPSGLRFITPRDFILKRRTDPSSFVLVPKTRGRGFIAMFYGLRGSKSGKANEKGTPLFNLVDGVTIPERPFITPAVEAAADQLPALLAKRIAEQGGRA